MIIGTLLVALRGDLRRPWDTLDGAESLVGRTQLRPRSDHKTLTSGSLTDGSQSKLQVLPLRLGCLRFQLLLFGVFR